MRLVDIYTLEAETVHAVLWELLSERLPQQSISHRAMPAWHEHVLFVNSRPYEAWYLIEREGEPMTYIGACYLSKQREIGIFLFRQWIGGRLGEEAVRLLMHKHPGRFLANVNPDNRASAELFHRLGFTLLQLTYERPAQ